MRILLGHTYYRQAGGEDAVFRNEADLLKSRGHEVILYERRNDEISGYPPLRKARALFSPAWSEETRQQLRELIRAARPDVAHFHNLFYVTTPSAYRVCREEGVPVVQTLHNFRPMCLNGLLLRKGRPCEDCLTSKSFRPGIIHRCFRNSWILSASMAKALSEYQKSGVWQNGADRYIALSQFSRSVFVRAGFPAERIVVKPNGLPLDIPLREGGGEYAVYAGRLSEEKGAQVAIAAWREDKDLSVALKIAGDGPLRKRLEKEAQGETGRVEFTGFLSGEPFGDLLSRAFCVLIPSVCYENFPLMIVEAFARGIPVVAARQGSLQELVDYGKTGLVFDPGSPRDLARKVRWLCDHPEKAREMGQNARQVFEQRFSSETNYRRLIEIYATVIGEHKGHKGQYAQAV